MPEIAASSEPGFFVLVPSRDGAVGAKTSKGFILFIEGESVDAPHLDFLSSLVLFTTVTLEGEFKISFLL